MHYIRQHISAIIATYDGSLPLAHFLKNYFQQYPKLGSRDRRILTTLAYSWYRVAKGIENKDWLDLLTTQMFAAPDQFRNFSLHDWLTENNIPFNTNALLSLPNANVTLSSKDNTSSPWGRSGGA